MTTLVKRILAALALLFALLCGGIAPRPAHADLSSLSIVGVVSLQNSQDGRQYQEAVYVSSPVTANAYNGTVIQNQITTGNQPWIQGNGVVRSLHGYGMGGVFLPPAFLQLYSGEDLGQLHISVTVYAPYWVGPFPVSVSVQLYNSKVGRYVLYGPFTGQTSSAYGVVPILATVPLPATH